MRQSRSQLGFLVCGGADTVERKRCAFWRARLRGGYACGSGFGAAATDGGAIAAPRQRDIAIATGTCALPGGRWTIASGGRTPAYPSVLAAGGSDAGGTGACCADACAGCGAGREPTAEGDARSPTGSTLPRHAAFLSATLTLVGANMAAVAAVPPVAARIATAAASRVSRCSTSVGAATEILRAAGTSRPSSRGATATRAYAARRGSTARAAARAGGAAVGAATHTVAANGARIGNAEIAPTLEAVVAGPIAETSTTLAARQASAWGAPRGRRCGRSIRAGEWQEHQSGHRYESELRHGVPSSVEASHASAGRTSLGISTQRRRKYLAVTPTEEPSS